MTKMDKQKPSNDKEKLANRSMLSQVTGSVAEATLKMHANGQSFRKMVMD